MIRGIGCDILDLRRIQLNDRFAHKILTPHEFEVYSKKGNDTSKREFLGGRFAGKEAFFKAIGIEKGFVSFQDIEILNDTMGKPEINYPNTFISIAHEKDYVVAYIVVEEC